MKGTGVHTEMKYVGVVKTFHSNTLDEDVSILKMKEKKNEYHS